MDGFVDSQCGTVLDDNLEVTKSCPSKESALEIPFLTQRNDDPETAQIRQCHRLSQVLLLESIQEDLTPSPS